MNEIVLPTGFYGESDEIIVNELRSLTDENDINFDYMEYSMDASYFLQGCCDLFAVALHRRFGYPVFVVRNDGGFHEFCETIFEGKTVYVDVRGMTTDWNEFRKSVYWQFEEGESFIEPVEIPGDYLSSIRDDLRNDVFDRTRFDFAERIIEQNIQRYSVRGS